MSYEKINDKLYTMRIDGQLTDIKLPYGKVQALFEAFVGSGGVIGSDGTVQNDIVSLIANFGRVGDILLSQYGPKGEILQPGDCRELSVSETVALFQLASEVVSNFIVSISEVQTMNPSGGEMLENEPVRKARKTK